MAFITWNSRFSVGIDDIDKQHMKLIGYINELHDAMKIGKAKDIMAPILKNLVDYTIYHFSLEEKYLAQNFYPGYLSHKKEHTDFVDHVSGFQKSFNEGSAFISIDVLNYLREWITHHILETDQKYSPFLKGKGIN
ncbi:MAG: hemerythrin family protein [Ignavibacteria bacterium]|jgi:hemerythrin|nr:hemerythrin family protein [Ignavibacteria bacterium]MCU7502534.1 hemerythrin family protein [Ignavibacteria bacterium]MCU7515263.1 hemerythrin family protein [Ignavibacteria bacterium]